MLSMASGNKTSFCVLMTTMQNISSEGSHLLHQDKDIVKFSTMTCFIGLFITLVLQN